eukprot:s4249_g5.t1
MGCARDQPCRGCCLSRRQFSGSSVVLALYPDNFNLFLQAGDCVCFARWEKALLAAPKCLLCSAARCAQISAGVPEWQGLTPTLEKVGAENIRLGWPVPLSGGSPILGYHVDMEANGDGSWERIYDGTNQPSKLTFTALGLHASLTYNFRVFAENRVGFSSYTEASVRISDLMAAHEARPESIPVSLSADVEYTARIRSVDPVTQLDESVGGRRFILSVHDVCELDSTGTICVRVAAPHPDYAPDVLGEPICCIHSLDQSTGLYRFPYTLRKAP